MPPVKPSVHRIIPRLCGAILVWTALILCLTIFCTPLMFDESVNAHLLWLVSIGRVPHVDFWCPYPALGYVLTLPYFRLFPETIYTVLALRFLVLICFLGLAGVLVYQARGLGADWFWGLLALALVTLSADLRHHVIEFRSDGYAALAALLALAVMSREPTSVRCAFAAGLSVISVVTMPKYVYPLLLANAVYLAYGCFKLKRVKQSLIAAGSGALLAAVLSHFLLSLAGTGLSEDVYWSPILMLKYMSHLSRTQPVSVPGTIPGVIGYFTRYWWIGLILLPGAAGWLAAEIKERGVRFWTGAAVLSGVVLSWAAGKFPHRQYIAPGLFCLVLFAPYIGRLFRRPSARAIAALVMAALLAGMNFRVTRSAAAELTRGAVTDEGALHSLRDFAARQAFLDLIPSGEKVIGYFYFTHPIFRENQTFVTYDAPGGNPRGFLPVIPMNSPVREYFQPGYLEQSLETTPPASIDRPCNFYPPGWNRVLSEFLERHADGYRPLNVSFGRVFIRKDLLPETVPTGLLCGHGNY